MKDRLDGNDYVGMIAVLAQQYATRHGYDYLQLAAISTVGLVNRVHQVGTTPPPLLAYPLYEPLVLFYSNH